MGTSYQRSVRYRKALGDFFFQTKEVKGTDLNKCIEKNEAFTLCFSTERKAEAHENETFQLKCFKASQE